MGRSVTAKAKQSSRTSPSPWRHFFWSLHLSPLSCLGTRWMGNPIGLHFPPYLPMECLQSPSCLPMECLQSPSYLPPFSTTEYQILLLASVNLMDVAAGNSIKVTVTLSGHTAVWSP